MEDEKRKIFSESISSNPQTSKKGRKFLLTGFRKKEIKHICFVIAQLGATCLSDNKTKVDIFLFQFIDWYRLTSTEYV